MYERRPSLTRYVCQLFFFTNLNFSIEIKSEIYIFIQGKRTKMFKLPVMELFDLEIEQLR